MKDRIEYVDAWFENYTIMTQEDFNNLMLEFDRDNGNEN